MLTVFSDPKDCCGCTACQQICPRQAITMQPDAEGFLYPSIQQSACIDCNVCISICPLRRDGHCQEQTVPRFYAARHRSADVLRHSTSGGAFTALSDAMLRQGGVIYGADYDEQLQVRHCRAATPPERNRLRISKYVQSDLGDTYRQIKADLQNDYAVLFTGTPCQTAGLRAFLGASPLTAKLYLCDLICHSIPSPLIWEEYKHQLEKEHGGKLRSVQFRSKKDGWSRANSNKGFLFTTDASSTIQEDDRFYHLFFKVGAITRPSCSACRFTTIHRAADITIADYWGIEKYAPHLFDAQGVSLIMVNTAKGAALFEQSNIDLIYEERPKEESLAEQKRLSEPVVFPSGRSQFWDDYRRHGFAYVLNQATK